MVTHYTRCLRFSSVLAAPAFYHVHVTFCVLVVRLRLPVACYTVYCCTCRLPLPGCSSWFTCYLRLHIRVTTLRCPVHICVYRTPGYLRFLPLHYTRGSTCHTCLPAVVWVLYSSPHTYHAILVGCSPTYTLRLVDYLVTPPHGCGSTLRACLRYAFGYPGYWLPVVTGCWFLRSRLLVYTFTSIWLPARLRLRSGYHCTLPHTRFGCYCYGYGYYTRYVPLRFTFAVHARLWLLPFCGWLMHIRSARCVVTRLFVYGCCSFLRGWLRVLRSHSSHARAFYCRFGWLRTTYARSPTRLPLRSRAFPRFCVRYHLRPFAWIQPAHGCLPVHHRGSVLPLVAVAHYAYTTATVLRFYALRALVLAVTTVRAPAFAWLRFLRALQFTTHHTYGYAPFLRVVPTFTCGFCLYYGSALGYWFAVRVYTAGSRCSHYAPQPATRLPDYTFGCTFSRLHVLTVHGYR